MDVFYDSISTDIEHRLVELETARDVLRFRFVTQNSISPLDLSQPEGRIPFNRRRGNFIGFSDYSVFDSLPEHPKCVINTEEKCRNRLSRTRDFLYRLHIDLPANRECSLKNGPEPENLSRESWRRHIGKLTVHPKFYFTLLATLVEEAVQSSGHYSSGQKLKIIKWLVTFDAVAKDDRPNHQHVLYFAKYMCSEVTESAFVQAFLKRVDLNSWIYHHDRPEILELILYQLRRNGYTFSHNRASRCEPIDWCILSQHFLNITTILKYQDAPRLPPRDVVWSIYVHSFNSDDLSYDLLREAEKWMSPRRFYFMVQIIRMYLDGQTTSVAECLRLLWRSLPDAFISFEEIETALKAGLSSETIKEVYNFYSRAVGVSHARVDPRSLKHLCRSAVRGLL